MKILLTGGAGYIGSHTYVALFRSGFTPVILDNFSNSNRKVIERLEKLTGKPVLLETGDVRNAHFVEECMVRHQIAAVIHFAALKAVGESVANPILYYQHNNNALLTLLEVMLKVHCQELVFSSSATVYGEPVRLPIDEKVPLGHTNPYGHTKIMGEEILSYVHRANPNFVYAILRYFNPVGAHESGLIGEDPKGTPNNLMPYVCQVATGKRPTVNIFGHDYNTPDGTGIRDYIHVMDLAEGHVLALRKLLVEPKNIVVNLGTGRGYSVLELIHAFEKASGKKIPHTFVDKRPGDVASCYADPSLAEKLLGWKATRDLDVMCADAWRWQLHNPQGFKS